MENDFGQDFWSPYNGFDCEDVNGYFHDCFMCDISEPIFEKEKHILDDELSANRVSHINPVHKCEMPVNKNQKIMNEIDCLFTSSDDENDKQKILNETQNSLKIHIAEKYYNTKNSRNKNGKYKVRNRENLFLSGEAEQFRMNFYHFTIGQKFDKRYVQKLHNAVCKSLGLRPINRNEYRSIKLYFQNFAQNSNEIICAVHQYLQENPNLKSQILDKRKFN